VCVCCSCTCVCVCVVAGVGAAVAAAERSQDTTSWRGWRYPRASRLPLHLHSLTYTLPGVAPPPSSSSPPSFTHIVAVPLQAPVWAAQLQPHGLPLVPPPGVLELQLRARMGWLSSAVNKARAPLGPVD